MTTNEKIERVQQHLAEADTNLRKAIGALNTARLAAHGMRDVYDVSELISTLRDDIRDCLSGPNYRSIRSIKAELDRCVVTHEDAE